MDEKRVYVDNISSFIELDETEQPEGTSVLSFSGAEELIKELVGKVKKAEDDISFNRDEILDLCKENDGLKEDINDRDEKNTHLLEENRKLRSNTNLKEEIKVLTAERDRYLMLCGSTETPADGFFKALDLIRELSVFLEKATDNKVVRSNVRFGRMEPRDYFYIADTLEKQHKCDLVDIDFLEAEKAGLEDELEDLYCKSSDRKFKIKSQGNEIEDLVDDLAERNLRIVHLEKKIRKKKE